MTWLNDLPVQRKLGFAMLLTSTIVIVIACAVFLTVEYYGYKNSLVHTVATLAQVTADNSTAAVAFADKKSAAQNLKALHAEPQIIAATLFDAEGEVFARFSAPTDEEILKSSAADAPGVRFEHGYVVGVQPVVEGNRRLGTLTIQASMDQIYQRMRTYASGVLGVLGLSFALAWLIASMLRRTLARPILELASTAEAVSAQRDYTLRARQYGSDELGRLTVTFNDMLDRTQSAIDALEESEDNYRQLVRALPTAAYMCDRQGRITIFNEAAAALWGRSPKIGEELWCGSYKICRPDGTPIPHDQGPLAVALREGRAISGEEIIIERPDGSQRNVQSHPEPIRDATGEVVGIVNMLVDITEQKRADASVRQLAAIVESSDDAIISKDLSGAITTWNSGAELLYGYTAAEIIGRSVTVLMPPDRVDEEPRIMERIRRDERIEHYETVRRHQNGTLIDISLTVSPIKDAKGRIIGASKIARDITERKRAGQQADFLSRLAQALSLLNEPDEITRTASREVGSFLGANRCYFGEFDQSITTGIVKGDWARDDVPGVSGIYRMGEYGKPELWQAMVSGPLAVSDVTTYPPARDFAAGYAQLGIRALAATPYFSDGSGHRVLVVTSDQPRIWREDEIALLENVAVRVWPLIERARGQLALRESERRQRELLRALPVACYTLDEEGRLTFFNDAAVQLWGRTPELLSTSWCGSIMTTMLDGEPFPREELPVVMAMREKRPVRGIEAYLVRPDGTRRWIVSNPDPIFDAEGRCIGVINVVMDVTAERTAQEKVQKAAEHLNLAIASANLGDWNWDAETDIITLSPRTAEIYGVQAEPGLTRSGLRNLLHEDDQARARMALQQAVETDTDYDIEYRVNRPDGTLCWVAAKGRCFHDGDGKVRGMVGVAQDITERKLHTVALEKLSQKIKAQAQVFDATLSNITDLAYTFDLKGRWMYANKPLLEIWGRSLEQITGKSCLELGYPPELAARLEAQVQEVIATKKPVRGETAYASAAGKVDDHEYIFSPVQDAQGNVTAVVGTTRLITERKRIEETLRQHEAQLRLVTDNAPIFLVRTDRNHRYTFVNRTYAERNGFSPAAMIGKSVAEVLGTAAHDAIKAYMDQALAGSRVEFEMEIPYAHIGARWIHVIYVPERDARGEVFGLLAVISDIGARKEAELELKRARDEAVAASRAKDDFLAALSHELRTPLNPVLLLASAAANNPDLPVALRDDFELIRKNVDLEARLIDDLLDLTRITRGKIQLDLRRCEMHTIIDDALANVRGELQGKHQILVSELNAGKSTVSGDSVRLQQILWNILKNAVKFTPEEGRISVETTCNDERLFIKIADTGIGMTPEEIGRVFQAFSQGEHADPGGNFHRFGGLGLGMTISKMLVDLHNGQIQVFSAGRGQGSTFIVELPLWLASADRHPEPRKKAGPPKSNSLSPLVSSDTRRPFPVSATRRRILLVEDHAPTRLTLLHLLKSRNFDVMPVASATEAYQLVQTGKFDLIISDVGLPDRNGYDLMADVRAIRPDLAGIALSGYGMEEDIIRSQAAGFSVHLVKPITIGVLEEAIARLIAAPQNVPTVAEDRP